MPKSKYDWDLSLLYKSDNDKKMEVDFKRTEQAISKFSKKWRQNQKYLSDPKVMKIALDEYNKLLEDTPSQTKKNYYFELRETVETNNHIIKAKSNQANEESIDLANRLEFFEIAISKIPQKIQKNFLSSNLLKDYHFFLLNLFKKSRYILTELEEKIINLMSSTSYSNWVKMTDEFISKETMNSLDIKGYKKKHNLAQLMSLLSDQNRKIRDSAVNSVNQIFEKYKYVAEHELNSVLQTKKTLDNLRGHLRPDSSRHMSDNIETEIVDAMINTVSKRNHISKRYYKLKSKLLGIKKLKYHERNVPYLVSGKENTYTFDKACKLINETFSEIDTEFATFFDHILSEKRIDVFPKANKTSGAFCAHSGIKDPTYIFLNYNNKLDDILTIAHETGHAINNELTRKSQKAIYFGTSLSTAEVASTFMENFALEKIVQSLSDQKRLEIIMSKLNDSISTIFRQVACYLFENDLHKAFRKKGYLSEKAIGDIFKRHMKSYMGQYVEQSRGCQNWWVYWSHIRNPFYVYSYASGLLISLALQNSVKKDPKFIQKVKVFLSSGTSASPKEIFLKMGIDISKKTFWDKGLDEIELLLNQAEDLAAKLKL